MGKHSKTSTEIFIITKITLTYLWFDFPKNCDKDSLCPQKYLILQNKVILNTAPAHHHCSNRHWQEQLI